MHFGDLTSLFQLGVALNLGYGALLSIAEPAKRQRDNSLFKIETQLILLAQRQEAEQSSDEEIEDVFDITKTYRDFFSPNPIARLETLFWESSIPKLMFLVFAMVSFGGLATCAAYAGSTSGVGTALAIGVSVNIPSLIIAITLLAISFWYNYFVFPIIGHMQEKLYKYKNVIGDEMKDPSSLEAHPKN